MGSNMPAADVEVTSELVRALLTSQHLDLADLPLIEFANGWDNVMFRLGDDLTVRVPRREMAGQLVANEIIALRTIGSALPITVPQPLRVGQPSERYPCTWVVYPWIDGTTVGHRDLVDPAADARRLGEFFVALHVAAPDEAPENPFRGHFIGDNDERFRVNVESIRDRLQAAVDGGVARVLDRWTTLIDVAPHAGPAVWIHGDLHALNVLQRDGRLHAIVDWGDVTSGDPAGDLAICWTLFDADARAILRELVGADDALWQRAEAWALYFCVMYLGFSADNAAMDAVGVRLVERLL
ncbi:MAG: aminoglycoside phosphotransferase family protein [Actinomycetota bacterium]